MDFLPIRAFDNYINASLTLARLDEEGITCYLKDEYTVTIDPLLSNAVGGIKLMVHADDIGKAQALLEGFDNNYRNSLSCPKCGSNNVEYIYKAGVKNWFTAIASWILGRYAVASEQVYHCYHCDFEFTELPDTPINAEEEIADRI